MSEEAQVTRELDALVAEKLFGWRWMAYPGPNTSDGKYLTGLFPPDAPGRICVANYYDRLWSLSTPDAERFSNWDELAWWESDGGCRHGFPHYSTDIAAAWGVVLKMRALNYGMKLMALIHDTTVFFAREAPFHESAALAPTAPLAICVAALRAVGVDEAEVQEAMQAPDALSP